MKSKSERIPLKSIQWNAVLEGPFLSYRSVQRYENTTNETIEINYSFPLPYGKSVITRFSVEINGVRQEAKALPKPDAEKNYEKAMESGDLPVMLEVVDKDFCTASLGNLKKGEKAEIIVEFLQLVEFNDRRARIKIPTVLDERYAANDNERPGSYYGVEPNLFADYPCSGELLIKKPFDSATVSSPTHPLRVSGTDEGLKVEIPNGKANSDFVLDIEVKSDGVLCLAKDGDQWACLASFVPQIKAEEECLDLSILLDCSGSMEGARIQWAKETLSKIVSLLDREDQVALYCFGNDCYVKKLPRDVEWEGINNKTWEMLHRSWEDVIGKIDADLGGTNLAQALEACGESFPANSDKSAILLITDGEVWDNEPVISAAQKTGRRIFVLGIGLAPYDNLLTKIADETGGCYDSVYSSTDVEGASLRVLRRLRAPVLANPKVQWPADALWTSKDRRGVFAADSYSSAAFLKKPIDSLKLTFELDGKEHDAKVVRFSENFGKSLAQLVANLRMVSSDNAKEQEELGIRYNLAGPRTNFLLVVERAEKDKPEDFAQLAIVPQMPARRDPLGIRSLPLQSPAPRFCISTDLLESIQEENEPESEMSSHPGQDEDSEGVKLLQLALELGQIYKPEELFELSHCKNKDLKELLTKFNADQGREITLADIKLHKKMINKAKSFFRKLYEDPWTRDSELEEIKKIFEGKVGAELFDYVGRINQKATGVNELLEEVFPGKGINVYHLVAYCFVMDAISNKEP